MTGNLFNVALSVELNEPSGVPNYVSVTFPFRAPMYRVQGSVHGIAHIRAIPRTRVSTRGRLPQSVFESAPGVY